MKTVGIALCILFVAVLFLSAVIVFRNRKTVTYDYAKDELTSRTLSNKINLL